MKSPSRFFQTRHLQFAALSCILLIGSSATIHAETAVSTSPWEKAEVAFSLGKTGEALVLYRRGLETLLEQLRAEDRSAVAAEELAEGELAILTSISLLGGRVDEGMVEHLADWVAADDAGELPAPTFPLLLHCRSYLGNRNPDAASELWLPLGHLLQWRVLGPFDNERGASFSQPLGPEAGGQIVSPGVEFEGKKRRIRWRTLPALPRAGQVELGALFRPNDEALAYAATFVRAPAATPAAIRFGSNDGFRLWVNGSLVASEDLQRPSTYDQNTVGVQLQKGFNSILFKITQSRDRWVFTARLTSPDGRPLTGVDEAWPSDESLSDYRLVADTDSTDDAVDSAVAATEAETAAVAYDAGLRAALQRRIDEEPTHDRLHYLLGRLEHLYHSHDRNAHPDKVALERALSLNDAPAVYHSTLASTLQRRATIAAQKDDNAWRTTLLEASKRGSARADLQLAGYYATTFGNLSEADRLLSRALERNPNYMEALDYRGELHKSLGYPLGKERTRRALAGTPRFAKVLRVRLRHVRWMRRRGDLAGAERETLAILRDHPIAASHLRTTLASLYSETERFDDAVGMLQEASRLAPYDNGPRLRLAEIFEGRDRIDEALKWLGQAIEICPEDEELHERRGRTFLRHGRRAEGLAAFDTALELQPNLPHLREYVEFLQAESSEFEERLRRDAVEIARAAWDGPESDVDAPVRVLLDLKAIRVQRDGTTQEYVQRVAHVLNERGVREYDRFRTYYAGGEQVVAFKAARVLRPDGSTAGAKLRRFGASRAGVDSAEFQTHRTASVDLPPISVGDVVEIEYVREDLAQSFFGDYFGHREFFQGSHPVASKTFVLELPKNREFYFHQRGLELEPQTETTEETVTRTWTAKNLAALEPEPGMAPGREILPFLEVSTFANWKAFNDWYWNLIRRQFESHPDIVKTVQRLTSGAPDELAKIRAIYNFVVTDIRYNAWEFGVHGFKPYNASTIFARRFGDCKDKATLMTVMLREAGIDSNPVLINAEQLRGEEDFTLPLIRHFNHCISYVPANGERPALFLDGTAQRHNLEQLPSMDRGARVLVVAENGGRLETIPWNNAEDLSWTEEQTVTINEDGSAEIQVRVRCRGDFAVRVRQQFELEARRKESLERAFGARFANAEVVSHSFSNLAEIDAPVHFGVRVKVPSFVIDSDGAFLLRAPEDFVNTATMLSRYGGLEEREHDVILGNPRRARLVTRYRLPTGVSVESLPKEQEVKGVFGSFLMQFRSDDPHLLVAEREIEIVAPRVAVEQYSEFREFTTAIAQSQRDRIVLKRTP